MVLASLQAPRGEFTVVVDMGAFVGQITASVVDDATIVAEFGHLTDYGLMDRRHAIAALTKKYGRTRNDLYAVIERAKKSVV